MPFSPVPLPVPPRPAATGPAHPLPADGARPLSLGLRLAVFGERLRGAVQPRVVSALLLSGALAALVSVGLGWLRD